MTTINRIATIAIATILLGSVVGIMQISPAADAHTIKDKKVDKEFVLCAIETDGQSIYPDNDIDGLIVGSADGVFYPESWTFALIDADDIEPATQDQVDAARDHDTVNGQNHAGAHYNCNDEAVADASAPGPSISVDRGDVVRITLVSDIDNEHMHSIDQHALNGDEHVNSGPIQQGHMKTWIWKSDQAGSFLYHCAANGLFPLWTHINNGMYGNIVVQPKNSHDDDDDDNGNGPAVEYSVMFADMYTTSTGVDNNHEFDLGAFVAGDNNIMVTNGQAFNYAPFIGADWNDGEHTLVNLNPIDLGADNVGGVPILAPVGEITRWYITNPGPNNFLAWHFIGGQMDVRDGSTPKELMTPVANEENWTVPPGSSSTTDTVFPSVGPYIGLTHKLNDVVKGGAFAVIACDIDKPKNNADHPLSTLLCETIGLGGEPIRSIEDINAFNAAVNPKVIVKEI